MSGLSAPDFLTHDFVEGSYEVASQELRAKNPFAPLQRNKKIGRRHEADFCSDIDFSSMMLSRSLLVLLSRPETRRLLSRLSRTGTASLRNWAAIGRKSHESDTRGVRGGYSMRLFIGRVQSGMETHIFQEICAKHSASYSR